MIHHPPHLACLLLSLTAPIFAADVPTAYPLKIAPDHRHFVDQHDRPVLMTIDTAWTLLTNVSRADAREYMKLRRAQGFDTIISYLISFDGLDYRVDGLAPFAGPGFSHPNDAYFARIDGLLHDAADLNMQLILCPASLSNFTIHSHDRLPPLDQWTAYGDYLGRRYAHADNLIWCLGGDHDPLQTWGDDKGFDYTPSIDALATAIKARDRRHLMTYHPAYGTLTLAAKPWFDFYAIQENRADSPPYLYTRIKPYYDAKITKPVLNLEPAYETGDAVTNTATTPYQVRRNNWWTFLSGTAGVAYGGHRATWYIGEHPGDPWRKYIDLPGARQTTLPLNILKGHPWDQLVPDTDHALLPAGAGTFGQRDYVAAAHTPDGQFFLAYLPAARPLTIDCSKCPPAATATWIDPTTGKTAGDSIPIDNHGTRPFIPPARNSAGDSDWLFMISIAPFGG